ncbi:hypothetical protein SFRURICE_000541 [Spodoptera frugiperda]|nr:hypothetical protein SFRURICE_000541 [Spodoptera frugiperda]
MCRRCTLPMARNAAIQYTPTFHYLYCMSLVIGGEPIAIYRRKKRSNYSPDPGIEPEIPCPLVALASTRPKRQYSQINYGHAPVASSSMFVFPETPESLNRKYTSTEITHMT